jgi:hypothetical protein
MEQVAAGAHRFEFFGGEKGTERPMHMTRHHLVFDPGTRWGESQTESSLPFEEFSAATRF